MFAIATCAGLVLIGGPIVGYPAVHGSVVVLDGYGMLSYGIGSIVFSLSWYATIRYHCIFTQ